MFFEITFQILTMTVSSNGQMVSWSVKVTRTGGQPVTQLGSQTVDRYLQVEELRI